MNHLFEPLEGRTLFAATLPASVTATYAPIFEDIGVLQADAANDEATAGSEGSAIVADEKALGRTPALINLIEHALIVGGQTIAQVRHAAGVYIQGARGEFTALERLDSTNTTNPTAKTAARYAAAIKAATKSEPRRVVVLQTALDKAIQKLAAALIELASSTAAANNPTLQAALRQTAAEQEDVGINQDDHLAQLSSDVDSVLGITAS
jgi:hypothetical protein